VVDDELLCCSTRVYVAGVCVVCRLAVTFLLAAGLWSVGCSPPANTARTGNTANSQKEKGAEEGTGEMLANYRVATGKDLKLVTWTDLVLLRPFDPLDITVRVLPRRKPADKELRVNVHVELLGDEDGKLVREAKLAATLHAIPKGPHGWQAHLRNVFNSDGFLRTTQPKQVVLPRGEYRVRITVRTAAGVHLSTESYVEVKVRFADTVKHPDRMRLIPVPK
jgi:hypothetical protein